MSAQRQLDELVKVDVSVVPWSHRGSYLSLSTKAGSGGTLTPGNDVYLISQCRPSGLPLFALCPLLNGQTLGPPSGFHKTPSPTTWNATPSLLQWKNADSVVAEATFQDVRCLRFRGTVPFALDSDVDVDGYGYIGAYVFTRPPSSPESKPTIEYVLNTFKPHRFIALKGNLSMVNGDDPSRVSRRVQIEGADGNPEWELLFCEVETDSSRSYEHTVDFCESLIHEAQSKSFNYAAHRMENAVDEYTRKLCYWSPEPSQSERLASYITWTSTVRAGGNFTREAVLMSKLWMNKVWSWDNCINAVGISPLGLNLAMDQMRISFDRQTPDGRLPDSVDWLHIEWAYTKPPVQGWTLLKLLEQYPDMSNATLREFYGYAAKFTEFWLQHRRTKHSILPYYSHGNDSGWDNSTAFDAQPVIVSPDCAAYLVIQLDVLAILAARLVMQEERGRWEKLKNSITEALVKELWDGNSFLIKDAVTGKTRSSTSLIRLMPLVAAKYLPTNIVDQMASDLSKHLSEWGLATEEIHSPLYESDGYWRGPIWAPVTLLIESGLRMAGRTELANVISQRFLKLCEKSGFAENYDAVTGVGLRDLSYTWASSAYLIFAKEAAQRKNTT